MLTKVDIERIMAAKRELTESIMDKVDFELIEDTEVCEMPDEDMSVSETNGLM